LDLEGQGDNSIARIKQVFAEIIGQPVEDDGLIFDLKSLRVARIKEEQEYEGLRINFIARLERAKIHMQVDVGFGDIIVPAPEEIEYSQMLDFPSARLMAYPRETVVAEKLEAMVKLGMINTRMKDFYDLWKPDISILMANFSAKRSRSHSSADKRRYRRTHLLR